jgi:hypothetical protein
MDDLEVQHLRHRDRLIHEVDIQLDVPTSMTPVPSHLLHFHFVGCAKEVNNLINHPVVNLLGTRVGGGTSAEVVPKRIDDRYIITDTRGKECLSETSRPGLISVMRPDLFQSTHGHDTSRGVYFF